MDSFMKDVAAAASGSEGASEEPQKKAPLIVEQMSTTKKKEAGAGGARGPTDSGEGQRQQPTEHEQQQMLDFLQNLETMKETNPSEYAATMEALMGKVPGTGRRSGSGDDSPEGNSLEGLMAAVKGMRAAGEGAAPAAEINLPGSTPKQQQPGINITPEPGFSFKTKPAEALGRAKKEGESGSVGKIFVNICVHEKLTPPALKKRLNEEGEEVEGMNIPMSVGQGRAGKDKAGETCMIYDIIVNPEVVKEAEEDKSGKYRDFVCQLGMQCIEQKFSVTLDRRYKLPKLKYMGEVESQHIQDRSSAPVIEEVSKDSPAAKKALAARLKKEQEEAKAKAARAAKLDKPLPYFTRWTFEEGACREEKEEAATVLQLYNGEYKEPMQQCEAGVSGIAFTAEVESYELDLRSVEVKLSPYKLQLKIPGFKALSLALPCAVDPAGVACSAQRREGYAGLIDLSLHLPLDSAAWGETIDPGSKPWLLSHALASGEGSYNPYALENAGAVDPNDPTKGQAADSILDDPFHLRVPNTDATDAPDAPVVVEKDEELPEDRFHKQDATSQYNIGQREQVVKDKWEKHREAKEERETNPDPNVEYIDMEDFKPGGKLGPQHEALEQEQKQKAELAEDVKKAASVLSGMAPVNKNPALEGMSSDLWSELI